MKAPSYRTFLKRKVAAAAERGIEVAREALHPTHFEFQKDVILWALRGGCRAIFARFGMGKTRMQLEIARQILAGAAPDRQFMVVIPLNMRHEFRADAEALGMRIDYVRDDAELAGAGAVVMTNYERVRDGHFSAGALRGLLALSLDEASILRGFGGTKTFRELMKLFEGSGTYRFVATATPSPNEYIELLAYAAFLDIMDVGQAKTRFFKRDATKADTLSLHPHKEKEFWLWVSTWALFITKPSDLGYSDEGYELPQLDVVWHEIPSDHREAGQEADGQGRLLRNASLGVVEASREKRDSLGSRVGRLMELRAEEPGEHRLIWHDLEAERFAIEAAIPGITPVYGSQDLEEREEAIAAFSRGEIAELAAKPVMLGSGCNFQRHCARAVFLGIGFKFNDFIQAIHRLHRFLQPRGVRIDLIYTEAERDVRAQLEGKWKRYDEQVAIMTALVREYGLASAAVHGALKRSMQVKRVEAAGVGWRLVNNDCIDELPRIASDSVGLVLTSIPFSTQYEYTPSYRDFGHTDDERHFFEQMDYLTPELLRVVRPGRILAVHVKDRITPGGLTGLGFQTVQPFHADCIYHYRRHGFAYLGMKTIVTDVVRENNQTYRLGFTEQCKDGSRMGCGMPEYLLLFRKPPTDSSDGYADDPVVKAKKTCHDGEWLNPDGYSRSRWQLDAHGFMRSNGFRLLTPSDLIGVDAEKVYKLFRRFSLSSVYEFDHHVKLCEALEQRGNLPVTFMLMPPASWHPDVWSDVTRMRTLNGAQHAKGREMHLCPLQFDIVDRAIAQYTMPGELVLDPFAGLGTVPLQALKAGRRGLGIELSPSYFADSVTYLRAAEIEAATPTLFDLLEVEEQKADVEGAA